jgi:hypothetical protein
MRLITRLLTKVRDEFGVKIILTDHRRRAKRRKAAIQYAKGDKQHSNHAIYDANSNWEDDE